MTTKPDPSDADDTGDKPHGSDKPAPIMIPKVRLDEEVGKRRAVEIEYAEFADAVLSEIPENLKALIPAELGPGAKLKWFQEAKKTGVFDKKPDVPDTDQGKPSLTPKDRDLSTLPVHARIAAGYGKA